MMERVRFVKYCPLCAAENPERASICQTCFRGDLTRTRRERPRDEAAGPDSEDVHDGRAGTPAGPAAGAGAAAAPDGAAQAARDMLTLELVENPTLRFTVRDGQTVGRTDKADVVLGEVPSAEYIHGAHARLFRRGSQWFAQYLGGFNFIKVDGAEYRGSEEVALHDGSVLVLSLTPFYVRLGGGA